MVGSAPAPVLKADLAGRVAVVLGASAEGGIGWEIAETLAADGAKVVVGSRTLAPLQRLAERIGGTAVQCNACSEEDIKKLTQTALRAYGRVDIAVHTASQPVMGLISQMTQATLDTAATLNLFGPTFFVKYMAEAIGEDGSIIFISSMSAIRPALPHVAYAATKAAMDCVVRYAALEFGPRNIRVNSILPGPTESARAKQAFSDPAFRAAFESETPLGRVGLPADVANAVLWLACAPHITGLNLPVGGGIHLNRLPRTDELPGGASRFQQDLSRAGDL